MRRSRLNGFASIDAAVRSCQEWGFQVNLHPDAALIPARRCYSSRPNTETGDLDVAAIDSLSTGDQLNGSDTVARNKRSACQ